MDFKKNNQGLYGFLLVLFGFTGFQHFIEKKYVKGIIYLFTLGLFLIGWFFDVVVFIKYIIKNEIKQNKESQAINVTRSKNNFSRERTINITTYDQIKSNTKKESIFTYGNKLTSNKKDYVVLDVETTGLKAGEDAIIEIAILKYRNDILIDSYCELVNPKRKISEKITKLTGINDEMVSNAKTFDEQKNDILSFIENEIIIAHNATFDLRFLVHSLKMSIDNKYIDTLTLSRKLFNDEVKNCKLETLVKHFDLPKSEHRAEADCIATQELYLKIKQRILENKKK